MPKESILIVEDDATISLGIQDKLENLNYEIAGVAYEGVEALRVVDAQHPDLVLMDIDLGGKPDGIDAAQKIKERYSIPVVFLTAMVDEETIQRAKVCEPHGYIIKPIRQDELRTTIENAIYRHKLEMRLRQSEARYRELFETSLDGIVITDLAGKLVGCNPAFSKLLGYSADELMKMDVAALTPEEYLSTETKLIKAQALNRGYTDEFTKEYLHKNGYRVLVSLRVWVRKDSDGEPIGYWSIIRDITSQKAAENTILHQAVLAQTLVNLTAKLNSQLELPKLLELICTEIAQALELEATQVTLYDPEEDTLAIKHYFGPIDAAEIVRIPYPAVMFEQLAKDNTPYLIIPNVQEVLQEHPYFPFLQKHDVRTAVIVPLTSESRLVGTLDLATLGKIREFSEDELTFLVTFANQAATAIDHALLYQQAHSRAQELEILGQLSATLRKAVSPQEMLPILLQGIMELTRAEAGLIYLLGSGGNPIDKVEFSNLPIQLSDWFLPGSSAWGKALASDHILYDSSPGIDPGLVDGSGDSEPMITNTILVPLRSSNTVAALLLLGFVHQMKLEEQEQHILTSMAEIGGNALHRSGVMEMLEKRVIDRTRELSTLYDLTVFINSLKNIEEKLEGALRKLLGSIEADLGVIYRYQPETGSLLLDTQVNMPLDLVSRLYEIKLEEQLRTWLETSSSPWLASKEDDQNPPSGIANAFAFHTVINLPIRFEGNTLGLLVVIWKNEIDLTAERIALLIAVSERIGSAIQNDILLQKAQNAALLEERQRLARELHDSVTQSLYSLTLLAEAGRDLLAHHDLQRLESCLGDLGENSLQALKEMRMLIFELRPPLVGEKDLAKALQDRLNAVELRAGVKAQLDVEGTVFLPAQMQEELYHVAKEALNNSLKHSGATSVLVSIQSNDDEIRLSVEDNGKGFDPQANRSGGLGLSTMRERVERLHGSLDIDSSSGRGTKVTVILTINKE
jgi:PAS domain S-box-containing protein